MSEATTSRGHARQLGRVLGILDAMEPEGNEAVVVPDVRDALEDYAAGIAYETEPHTFQSLDAVEWRTLATFCDQLATRRHIDETARARQLADIAQARLQEVDQ
jgi:hypothetical protein